ncbi:tyrosine-protein phosphatase [Nocardioides sp. NPDC101246]|uniref:tyrosine-protein phosphatase n=1 Tax=Nocardioides sp. NPDC101246 TaxID=3364336 RepID=UPI003829D72E
MTAGAGAGANFRDLGGLRTSGGRRVRSGVLFRGEFPHWLVDGGEPPAGLRTAVDLRRPVEIELEDVDWSRWGVDRHRHSLGSGTVPFAVAHSDSYLAAGEQQLAETLRTVLEPGRLPAYFFCAAGKDRTGLLAIVLLSLAGVSRDDILADFRATGDGIGSVLERLGTHAYYRDLFGERRLEVFLPREESATVVLDWLQERGGARAWVASTGVPEAWIEAFRSEVLEADADRS